jgi:hypothetical protein
VLGFWHFTTLAGIFYVSFNRTLGWKEWMDTINGAITFGQKYVDWKPLKSK